MSKRITIIFYCLGLYVFCAPQQAGAEFALNFTKVLPNSLQNTESQVGGVTIGGQTYFLESFPTPLTGIRSNETVVDPETGLTYYHILFGTPADGFMQETFIRTNSIAVPTLTCPGGGNSCRTDLNNQDPLGGTGLFETGNAASNPSSVIIRQIMSDGEITSEFLKDKYDRKPLITEMISTPDTNAFFQADMRNSTYTDMNSPGTIVNTLSLPGTGVADFDMSRDAQITNITAGRYTYTNGTDHGGSRGTYNYIDGSANFGSDWSVYMDKLDPTNVWTFSTYKP